MSTNVKQVYALRTFLGVFESSAYPGTVTLLSMLPNPPEMGPLTDYRSPDSQCPGYVIELGIGISESAPYPVSVIQYTPHELALRIGFYHSCQSIGRFNTMTVVALADHTYNVHCAITGSMLSNALQTAIKSTMDNHLGMAGWRYEERFQTTSVPTDWLHTRWLFVVNAIMTVALGLAGFVMIPNWPDKPNPWAIWLKPRHYKIAVARTARFKRASNKKFTWATVKRSVKLPLFYLIPCLYVATVLAQAGYQCESVVLDPFHTLPY